MINIEFVLALADIQESEVIALPHHITLAEALPYFKLADKARKCIDQPIYGVFNQIVSRSYLLKEGDRIEVYRPLIIDPKQARKIRAEHRKKQNNLSVALKK